MIIMDPFNFRPPVYQYLREQGINPRMTVESLTSMLLSLILSILWLRVYILLKLVTITGTGRAITTTPLKEHILPTSLPISVEGTMSPYLK